VTVNHLVAGSIPARAAISLRNTKISASFFNWLANRGLTQRSKLIETAFFVSTAPNGRFSNRNQLPLPVYESRRLNAGSSEARWFVLSTRRAPQRPIGQNYRESGLSDSACRFANEISDDADSDVDVVPGCFGIWAKPVSLVDYGLGNRPLDPRNAYV
jgi:hypothetical protein